jgi:ribosomal protein S18 acetylase RimI-like enzyme
MNSNLHHTAPGCSLSSRLYETEDDLLQMQGLLMEARASTNDWHYAHVGELMWGFFMVTCHLDPQEYIRLWHDAESRLVAYVILGEDPSFDCQILPEYEWCGIEAEAMAWAETRISELRKLDEKRWSGKFVSGARQDDAKRIAFLEQHGFRYSGEFAEVNMLRGLDEPIPEPSIPAGCQVRALAADAGEISNRAGAERDVWLPWTVGNVSDDDYARLMRMPGYDRELDVVAIAPDGIIGAYVNCWIDPLNRIGDFGPVGARPAYRRQGLTRAVLLEGLRRFKERRMERACVSTGVANTPALRLYELIGFRIVNKYLDYVKKG